MSHCHLLPRIATFDGGTHRTAWMLALVVCVWASCRDQLVPWICVETQLQIARQCITTHPESSKSMWRPDATNRCGVTSARHGFICHPKRSRRGMPHASVSAHSSAHKQCRKGGGHALRDMGCPSASARPRYSRDFRNSNVSILIQCRLHLQPETSRHDTYNARADAARNWRTSGR